MPKVELHKHKEPVPKQDSIPGVALVRVKACCMLNKFENWKRGLLVPNIELQKHEEPVPKQDPVSQHDPVPGLALVRAKACCIL